MTAPWALRIKIRQRYPSAKTYPTRDGCEVRLTPSDLPIARGRSRSEAWQRAWDALDEMEVGHE